MTNRNSLLPPIHVHPILLVFVFISFITGTFVQLSIILAIVLFHEFGHFAMAKWFNWRIQKIMLWIFGGVMETDEHGNRPMYEDFLVTIAGPFQHVFIYVFLFVAGNFQFIPNHILDLLFFYNTVILLFNALPIYPLDGGKIVLLCLSMVFSFRTAYDTVILFSLVATFLALVTMFFFPFSLGVFLIMLFLLMENRLEWKRRYYVFIRFLLKRYEGNASVHAVRPISVSHQMKLMDVFSQFQRNKKHSIYITYPNQERKLIDENDCLHTYFYEKNYVKTIGELGSGLM
ncbi:MAG TPA: site-2 protease family protein [Bacillota bacterium]